MSLKVPKYLRSLYPFSLNRLSLFRNQKLSFVNATTKCQKKKKKEKGQILHGVNQGDIPFYISWRKAKLCLKFLKGKRNCLKLQVSGGLSSFFFCQVLFSLPLQVQQFHMTPIHSNNHIAARSTPAHYSNSGFYVDVHRHSLEDI